MRQKTNTTNIHKHAIAGIIGIASLSTLVQANSLEEIDMASSFSYEGNNCAMVYEQNRATRYCWEQEQRSPMITRDLGNGCVWKYYGSNKKDTVCQYRLEDLQLPEQTNIRRMDG